MSITLRCGHCERGRVMWAGDEYQCVQCGWVAPEDTRRRVMLAMHSAARATGTGATPLEFAFESTRPARRGHRPVRPHRGKSAAA